MDSTPPDSRDPRDAPQSRPLTFFGAAIWVLIAMLLSQVGALVTESMREGAMFDPVSRTACLALAYSAVLFGVLRVHEPQGSIRHVLALRPPSVFAIVLALAVGAALTMPSEWISRALESRYPTPDESKDAMETVFAMPTIGKRIAIFVSFVVVEPVLTELFFRGVIFTPLRRTRSAQAVILAVVAYETLGMLSDESPRLMLALLPPTLLFSWLRGATGSIWPAIAAHIGFTSVDILPMVFDKPELEPTRTLMLASGAVALTGLVGLSFLARTGRAATARQADAFESPL